MKISDKLKFINAAQWLMILCIGILFLFFISTIFIETFDLKVFTHRTNNFFSILCFGAGGIVLTSAIFTFILNISIIAESKIDTTNLDNSSFLSKKTLMYVGFSLIGLISMLFLGNFMTERAEKSKLQNVAENIISKHDNSFKEIANCIGNDSKHKEIFDRLEFLSNQSDEFPSIRIVIQGFYKGEQAFLEVEENEVKFENDKEKEIKPQLEFPYYQCQQEECVFFDDFFNKNSLNKYILEENGTYTFYYPLQKEGKKMVVIFSKTKREGEYGGS
jgi:hypothetical protein